MPRIGGWICLILLCDSMSDFKGFTGKFRDFITYEAFHFTLSRIVYIILMRYNDTICVLKQTCDPLDRRQLFIIRVTKIIKICL